MATALELAIDAKHPEPLGYDKDVKERGASPTTAASTGEPTLAEYMRHAEISRAREAGGHAGSETPPEKSGLDIDEELLNARRALRTASWAAIFYLITTDILGPFKAIF